jgi:phosphonopyruvate decarboxylase
MVLLIGWRAEMSYEFGQIFDEPQHRKQGQITLELLKVLEIPYTIIDSNTKNVQSIIFSAANEAVSRSGPVALVVRKGAFHKFNTSPNLKRHKFITREDAIKSVVANLPANTSVISTTGMISRELYEIRGSNNLAEGLDFLTVGGMGHASQIAAGLALANPGKKFVCLDGDGAVLMHTGALAVSADCPNLFHIVLNNGVHDSVGGQPTKGQSLRFDLIASALGYANTEIIFSLEDFDIKFKQLFDKQGSSFLEIRCAPGSRNDIGRPNSNLIERKKDFMNFVGNKN